LQQTQFHHDLDGVFYRRNSYGLLASWSPTLATPDALQFADLDCDVRPEIFVGGIMIPQSAGAQLEFLNIAK